MKHEITSRIATEQDVRNIVEWMHWNRDKNQYDPEVLGYESTRILAVDKDGQPEIYLPYQLVIMTDSLAPRPARTKREIAVALREAMHQVVRIARQSRIGEVYFLGSDDETVEFAKTHGYEEVKGVRLMRLKPARMNPPLPEDGKE